MKWFLWMMAIVGSVFAIGLQNYIIGLYVIILFTGGCIVDAIDYLNKGPLLKNRG